jgi:hypothetical protein
MKLTQKDKAFLERLRRLLDEEDLSVQFHESGVKRLVLRQNYGTRVESCFGMTRQGVRWRFEHLFNDIYPSAYETILFIESHFGTGLRQAAMAMARQRWELRKRAQEAGQTDLSRRETAPRGRSG